MTCSLRLVRFWSTARASNILAMPTLQLYRDGQLLTQIVGARSRASLLREIDPFLASEGAPGLR